MPGEYLDYNAGPGKQTASNDQHKLGSSAADEPDEIAPLADFKFGLQA